MLEYLHVKNLALIEECEIDFTKGLNILTGETGAGKSILMGSVNLCLGQRADKSMIRHNASEALVELSFRADERTKERLREMDLSADEDSVLILRKITPEKSIFKINGETVLVKQVKEIAEGLIDIHGQHEHQSLLNNIKQRDMIDAYAPDEINDLLSKVSGAASAYRKLSEELNELKEHTGNSAREISLLEYEVEEIENAALKEGEDEELEEAYKIMKASEKIVSAMNEAINLISSDNGENAGSLLSHAISRMNSVVSYDEKAEEMLCKLNEAESLLGDFSLEASRYVDSLSFDEETMAETEERLNTINSLKARFGNTVSDVLKTLEKKRTELDKLKNMDEYIEKLEKSVAVKKAEYDDACLKLTDMRKKASEDFSKELVESLLELNFDGVKFAVDITQNDTISASGKDSVEFMISTNPGEPIKPLKNVASGGELSRIMLAIKTIMAARDSIDSLIFDEIDTGISGKTAWEVSKKLARLSCEHQVISITHLAQIAAMADTHFEIKKSVFEDTTKTNILKLSDEGKIGELARLLGGSGQSEAAKINACELKQQADMEKQKYGVSR